MTEFIQQLGLGFLDELFNLIAFILPKWSLPTEYIDAFVNGFYVLYTFDNIFPIPTMFSIVNFIFAAVAFEFTYYITKVIISIINYIRGSSGIKV